MPARRSNFCVTWATFSINSRGLPARLNQFSKYLRQSNNMAIFSDFSIEAILGIKEKSNQKSCPEINRTAATILESFYIKTLALHHIKLAQMQLRPPSWSQRQQTNPSSSSGKPKKYSKNQIEILTRRYEKSKYISREEMASLAEKTDLSMLQVKIWFQNRRLKERKSERLF